MQANLQIEFDIILDDVDKKRHQCDCDGVV